MSQSPKPQAKMIIPKEHGVTYVDRGQLVSALKSGFLRQFQVVRMKKDIERRHRDTTTSVEVPIDEFDWCGGNLRKLAGFFATSEASAELADDAEILDAYFHDVGTAALAACEPEHVSLCRYRGPRDRNVRMHHRTEIGRIVEEQFAADNIGSIVLGKLTVGSGYSTPLQTAA